LPVRGSIGSPGSGNRETETDFQVLRKTNVFSGQKKIEAKTHYLPDLDPEAQSRQTLNRAFA
jgi:hypothetical protein